MPNVFDDLLPPLTEKPRRNVFDDILPAPGPELAPPPAKAPSTLAGAPEPTAPLKPTVEPVSAPELQEIFTAPTEAELRQAKGEKLKGQLTEERFAQEKQFGAANEKQFKELGDTRGEVVPFWSGVVQAHDTYKVYRAAKRVTAGTPEEGDEAFLRKHIAESNRPTTLGYEVGSVLKQMVPFAGELMATGGIYTGVRKGFEKVALKAAEKAIEKAALKAAAAKAAMAAAGVAGRTAGRLGGVGAQTLVARPGEIAAETFERMTPSINYDEDGNLVASDTDAKDPLQATIEATGVQMVELFTERAGGPMGRILGKLPGSVKLAALKEGLKARWLGRHQGTAVKEFLERTKKGTQWNGPFIEYLEERLGEAIKPAVGLEDEYKPLGVNLEDLKTKEGVIQALRQTLVEGLAFMVPAAASLAIQKGGAEIEGVKRGRQLRDLRGVRGTEARREEINRIYQFKQQQEEIENITEGIMEAGRLVAEERMAPPVTEPIVETAPVAGGPTYAEQVGRTETIDGGLREPEVAPENAPVPAVESGAGVPVSRPGEVAGTQEGVAVEPVVAPTPQQPDTAYDEAIKKARSDTKVFREAQRKYRAKEIGDKEFLAAREQFKKSQDVFDEAESKFIAETNAAATPTPAPVAPQAPAQTVEEELDSIQTQLAELSGKPGTSKQIKALLERRGGLLRQMQEQIRAEISAKQGVETEGTPPPTLAPTPVPPAPAPAPAQPPSQPTPTAAKPPKTPASPVAAPAKATPVPPVPTPVPAKPLSKSNQTRWTQALGRASAFMHQVGIQGTVFFEDVADSDVRTLTGAVATIGRDGRIRMFRKNMERSLRGLPEEDAVDWMFHVLTEEAIHFHTMRVLTTPEVEAVWDSLPEGARKSLLQLYAGVDTLQEAGMTKEQAGHEYLRGVLQERLFGTRTEGRSAREGTFAAVTEALRNALRKIAATLKALAGVNSYADQVVVWLETSFGSTTGLEQTEGTNLPANESEEPGPAALVRTPKEAAQELITRAQLDPARVELINNSQFIQTQSTLGGMTGSFNTLPAGARAHIKFVKDRIDVLRRAASRLRTRPSGNLEQMVNGVTNDPSEQAGLVFWAWENMHDFRKEHVLLGQRIAQEESDLEQMQKLGGVAQNPIQQFIQNAFQEWKDQLIGQRNGLLAATSPDMTAVRNINEEIKRLDEVKSQTPAFRVARAVLANPTAPSYDFATMGINGSLGAYLAQVMRAASAATIAQGQAAAQGRTRPPEELALEATIQEMQLAHAFVQSQILDSPQFQENYRIAAARVGAEAVVELEPENGEVQTKLTFVSPIDPNKTHTVTFSPHVGITDSNLDVLEELAGEMEFYKALPPDQQDPTKVAAYDRHLHTIYNFYFTKAFSPTSGHSMPNNMDLFHAMSGFGWMSTPEGRLQFIGGLNASIAMLRLRNYSQIHNLASTRFNENLNKMLLTVKAAATAHGMDPMTWLFEVSNPILAFGQELGSVRLVSGDYIDGVKITAQDIEASKAQKQFIDIVVSSVREMNTTQNRAEPLKVLVDGILPYQRDPQATGEYIVPRFTRPEANDYAAEWKKTWDLLHPGKDDAGRNLPPVISKEQARAQWTAYLGSTNSPQFRQIVVGHMRNVVRVPSYAKQFESPFRNLYVQMSEMINRNLPAAPKSFDDVIQFIAQAQAGIPAAKQLSTGQIEDQIHKEITQMLSNLFPENRETLRPSSHPVTHIDVQSSENFMVLKRGDQVLPDTLLSYAVGWNGGASRIVGNIQEVLADRYLVALERVEKELSTEITQWEGEIDQLKKAGVNRPSRVVQKRSRQQQLNGEIFYSYSEAKQHLRQVQRSIQHVRQLLTGERSLEVEEYKSVAKLWRATFPAQLLQTVGIVTRNMAGGPFNVAHQDLQMGYSARRFGLMIPGAKLVTAPTKMLWQVVGSGIVRMLTPFMAHKFFRETQTGRQMAQALQSGQGFYATWGGVLFREAMDQAQRYEKLRELGLTGSAPFWEQIRTYATLAGGRITRQEPDAVVQGLRWMESLVAGICYEFGILNWSPRASLARVADISANILAGKLLEGTLRRMQDNAMIFGAQREAAGIGMGLRDLWTAYELTGSRRGTAKQLAFIREKFAKAGINIDKKLFDYYRRVQAAKAAGQPTSDISALDDAEYNSALLVLADDINKGSFANRPELFTTSEFGRNFGMFFGYGAAMNERWRMAYSRFSQTPGFKGLAQGPALLAWLTVMMVAIGIGTEEGLVRPLTWFLYNEKRQVPKLENVQTTGEALQVAYKEAAPFAPMVMQAANATVTELAKPTGTGGGKVSLLPLAWAEAVMNTIREGIDTGSLTQPATRFVRQWFGNWKTVINRLPSNDGSTQYYNTVRTLRVTAPSDVNVRTVTGDFRRSATSDNVAAIVNAISRPSGPDIEWAMRERELGIAQLTKDLRVNPEGSIDQAVIAKMPFKAVLGREPTQEERDAWRARMTEEEWRMVERIEQGFADYRTNVGMKEPEPPKLGTGKKKGLR